MLLKLSKNLFALSLSMALLLGLQGCVGTVLATGAVAGFMVYNDRRDTATIAADKSLEFGLSRDISNRYRADPFVQVYVNSFNNQVLLTGQVHSEAVRQDIEQVARNRPTVRNVFNELLIAPPLDMATKNGDTYLTTATRAALVGIFDLPDFDPTRVKITTNRGVVYLMGLLTPFEAQRVTQQVRTVQGVQRVVTFFEFVASDGRTRINPSSTSVEMRNR